MVALRIGDGFVTSELLLLIDTAGADGGLALASGGEEPRVLRTVVLPGRSASERLFPALREMLAEEGRTAAELRAISVVVGPGSFTGVRVGLAAAKGLAEALGIPVVGLSRLAVLAAAARERFADRRARRLLALLDAGRGEMFAGRFREGETEAEWEGLLTAEAVKRMSREWTPVAEMAVGEEVRSAAPTEAVGGAVAEGTNRTSGAAVRVGETAWRGAGATVSEVGQDSDLVRAPLSAASGLRLAVPRVRTGAFDDIGVLDARYLRRTPAEVARERVEASLVRAQTM